MDVLMFFDRALNQHEVNDLFYFIESGKTLSVFGQE